MKPKDVPRSITCITSDVELQCTVAHNRIQELVLQACGFTQAAPNSKELNIQVRQCTHPLQQLHAHARVSSFVAGAAAKYGKAVLFRSCMLGQQWNDTCTAAVGEPCHQQSLPLLGFTAKNSSYFTVYVAVGDQGCQPGQQTHSGSIFHAGADSCLCAGKAAAGQPEGHPGAAA